MEKEINAINEYWSAANYLTVAQMYLCDNVLLHRPLESADIKSRPTGHWGVSPGLNFIFAHLNNFVRKYHYRLMPLVGTGHAGCSLLSNLYLDGTLLKYYPELTLDEAGIKNLVNINSTRQIRSEINPYIPGTIYDGGELGYSLPVSFGSVLDEPELITACIIGDGELETGTTSAAWNNIRFLNKKNDGLVLPIINLNGFKMGNTSLFSEIDDENKIQIFKSMGYEPIIVQTNHINMIYALERIHEKWQIYKSNSKKTPLPMLIFRSPKGWTAPTIDEYKIENSLRAHKNPLVNPKKNSYDLKYLEAWLKSYNPEVLFDKKGIPKSSIFQILPDDNYRIGMTLSKFEQNSHKKLLLPNVSDYGIIHNNSNTYCRNMEQLDEYLTKVCSQNKFIKIVSPDELNSNGFWKLKNSKIAQKNIMEILNENICQAWMQGYLQMGGNAIMSSYEAFMPIIESMISQYAKFIEQCNKTAWRKEKSSANYIISSLCWSNVYSHQNPEIISNMISSGYSFIKVYFPADSNELVSCVDYCLKTVNRINAIVTSKGIMKQWTKMEDALKSPYLGISNWKWISDPQKKVDIIIAVAGDSVIDEAVSAVKIIREYFCNIKIRFVYVTDITILGDKSIYKDSLSDEKFEEYFDKNTPVIFVFHGYVSVVKNLLFERISTDRISFLGYCNKGDYSTEHMKKLFLNGVSRFHIAITAVDFLFKKKKINKKEYEKLNNILKKRMAMMLSDECYD